MTHFEEFLFKEVKENKRTTKGIKRKRGITKKLQAKKRKVCNPVKLLK